MICSTRAIISGQSWWDLESSAMCPSASATKTMRRRCQAGSRQGLSYAPP